MTSFPPFSRLSTGWVSAPASSSPSADQLAEVELPTAPSALFFSRGDA
ncbi:MAG: hypothetical protein ABJO21_07230 [Marinomonas sp.]